MKKLCIFFLLSIIISVTAFALLGKREQTNTDYLRIHIRADSNEDTAQAVKYDVRDAIVYYLTPTVATCKTKAQALDKISANLKGIESVAAGVLREKGYFYGAKASVKQEEFPTRVYDGYTLPKGEYTALIIELGSGKGDNWWCVVYPPLCFASPTGGNVVYKSKIAEIIQNWAKNG